MTLAVNLANLANNVNTSGQLGAANGLTGAVQIANGGTNATTAAQARANLGVAGSDGSGASGTWNINISGNAATATNTSHATNADFATSATTAGSANALNSADDYVVNNLTTTGQLMARTANESGNFACVYTQNANANNAAQFGVIHQNNNVNLHNIRQGGSFGLFTSGRMFLGSDQYGNLTTPTPADGQLKPAFMARAWARFDGVNGIINSSGNVSSIVKGGTGVYTLNFAVSMVDTSYSLVASASRGTTQPTLMIFGAPNTGFDTTRFACEVSDEAGVLRDAPYVCFSIWR